jgi:hypothetical protein
MMYRSATKLNAPKKPLLVTTWAVAIASPLFASLMGSQQAAAQAQSSATPAASGEFAQRLAEQQRPRKVVPFDPKQFDKFVGYYQLGPDAFFTVTRNGDRFFYQVPGYPIVEIFPESGTKFFATVAALQLSFVTDAQGRATETELHHDGVDRPGKRIDESAMKKLEANREARVANKTPSPGTEAFLRRHIESLEKGQPNYEEMMPDVAAIVRRQLPGTMAMIARWGALKSITFKSVGPAGKDIYDVAFDHGRAEWRIAPLSSDGKVMEEVFQEVP